MMLSSAYYRRQADICLGMALAAGDQKTAEQFRALALEYLAKAADLGEAQAGDGAIGEEAAEIGSEWESSRAP